MLVVAKGTLIDWSEIYSAVADCEDREGGRGGYYRGLYHRRVSHDLAHLMFQVAFSKHFPFLLPLTCLLSLSIFENKPAILKEGLLTSDSSNPPDLHPHHHHPFCFKAVPLRL